MVVLQLDTILERCLCQSTETAAEWHVRWPLPQRVCALQVYSSADFLQVSLFLSISWLGIGVLWLSVVAICKDQACSASATERDAVAKQELTTAPVRVPVDSPAEVYCPDANEHYEIW